ncbi:MAG: ABC transporter ATP-binding protein/permease [Tissierellales bacterium]|jgi:ATP-binding cassette subfamily B protein|nr:ABC transporter ATP-binding protein/permease [Tissierellales bacterium]
MRSWIQRKLALSEKGSIDLIKGGIYSALVNLAMMMPVGIFIYALNDWIKPLTGAGASSLNFTSVTILVLIAFVLNYFLHSIQYSTLFLSTYRECENLRVSLAEKLRSLPLSFFGEKDLSDLTNRLMGDCTTLEHAFSHAIPQLIGSIISTIVILVSLLLLDWRMGLAVFWVVPVSFLLLIASRRTQKKSKIEHHTAKASCADSIQEGFENIESIKAYGLQKWYTEDLDTKLDESEATQVKSELMAGVFVTSAQAILRLGLATVILVGGDLFVNGETALITYLIFLITASRIYDPLSTNLNNIAEVFHTELPIARMKEIEEYPVQLGTNSCDIKNYDIKFEKVNFSYDKEDEKVLKDVSFTAKQGEVTALVGPSGSGKSTAAKLAARFWDVQRGSIKLGDKEISSVEPETLLKNYTMVFQDVTLFNDSVMENIRLGKRSASDKEVLRAAKLARCDDFVSRMNEGYHTVIGENGSTLSGGERQRISIARAMLKDAPIILLDEATASLDVENETAIQSALSELIKDKTVLVVAHRMRTIENADKVVVLEDGKVKEQGHPEELMKRNGLYTHMVKLQKESV